jgi:hypothetical protein
MFSTDLEKKKKKTKFHENPSTGSRVVARGETNMKKLIVAFRNFANMPKNFIASQNDIPLLPDPLRHRPQGHALHPHVQLRNEYCK